MSKLYSAAEWLRRVVMGILFLCAITLLAVPVAIPYGVEVSQFGMAALGCFWIAVLMRRQKRAGRPRGMPVEEI